MARVSQRTTRFRAAAAALGLVIALLTIIALACGGSEEETTSNSATSTAPPTGTVSFPSIAATSPLAGCQSPSPGATPPEVQAKSYPERPARTIDPARKYLGHVYTTRGHFIIELLPQIAPEHVNSFVFLARDRFYNGTTFHRVVKEPDPFVVQGGDPTGTGQGGPGYTVPLEPSDEPFVRGVVGMARTPDPDSAGSQWFVTIGDALFLNDPAGPREQRYTVFGKVTQGMEIVDCIEVGDQIIDLAIQEI